MKIAAMYYFVCLASIISVSSCGSIPEREQVREIVSNSQAIPATSAVNLSNINSPKKDLPIGPTKKTKLSTTIKGTASSIYFIDQRKGWVLLNGVLYRTLDSGKSWVKVSRIDLKNYSKMIFLTDGKGWIIKDEWNDEKRSNTILRTTDGGLSWEKILELPTPVYSVDFVSNQDGFVSGRWQPLQRTRDGGKSWHALNGIEGLNYLCFANNNVGWGFGGAVWHTKDGGETWEQDVPYEDVADLWDAKFYSDFSGWIIGSKNQLWHTDDGENWQLVKNVPSFGHDFTAFDFVNKNKGWITSDDGTVTHTDNGGATWSVIGRVNPRPTAIKFIDELNGWAIAVPDKLFHTSDGGMTWKMALLP